MPQRHVVEMIAALRTRVDAIRDAPAVDGGRRLVDESLLDDLAAVFDAFVAAERDFRRQGDHLAAARGALEGRFRRYQDLFELMPDGYLVTDHGGVIRDANRLAVALLARTRAEVVGRPIASFAAPLDRALVRRQLAIARDDPGGSLRRVELTLQPRNGPPQPVALTVAAVRDEDDDRRGFRLLVRDIRDQREVEERARAASALTAVDQAKDEFLAMLSHELRNPLHAIIGWTDILRSETLPGDQLAQALETIDRNARQLNRLVSELLDVSRIAQRKLLFEPRPCSLTAIVAGAFDTVGVELNRKQLRFGAKLFDPGPIVADPARLQQILSNLLGNAVRFTPSGGTVELRIDTRDGAIEIVVDDSGSGIEPDLLPYVFERFRQGEGAPTERGGGLGLGLPIARTLARMHGGDVVAASAGPGRGATFTVRLPLRRVEERDRSMVAGAPVEGAPRGRPLAGLRALVISSDPDAAGSIAENLVSCGASATVASPAEAASAPTWRSDVVVVVVPHAPHGDRLLAEMTILTRRMNGNLPVLAIAPSSTTARRWLSLPTGIGMCTRGDAEPSRLPSCLALLARIGGWAPSQRDEAPYSTRPSAGLA